MNEDWKLDMLRQMWSGKETDPDKEKGDKLPRKVSKCKNEQWPSIDLHRFNLLSKQLEVAEAAIDKAITGENNGLVIIHGKGQGVLKTELIKLLKEHHQIAEYKSVKDNMDESGSIRVRFK